MTGVDKIRVISANDMHVMMGQFIHAAKDIHNAMCLFDDDHHAQTHLNSAMHSALIGAEQCCQLHGSAKQRIANPEADSEQD